MTERECKCGAQVLQGHVEGAGPITLTRRPVKPERVPDLLRAGQVVVLCKRGRMPGRIYAKFWDPWTGEDWQAFIEHDCEGGKQ